MIRDPTQAARLPGNEVTVHARLDGAPKPSQHCSHAFHPRLSRTMIVRIPSWEVFGRVISKAFFNPMFCAGHDVFSSGKRVHLILYLHSQPRSLAPLLLGSYPIDISRSGQSYAVFCRINTQAAAAPGQATYTPGLESTGLGFFDLNPTERAHPRA